MAVKIPFISRGVVETTRASSGKCDSYSLLPVKAIGLGKRLMDIVELRFDFSANAVCEFRLDELATARILPS